MALSHIMLGLHLLNNSWDAGGAPAHAGVSDAELMALAAQAGSAVVRVPVALSDVGPDGLPEWGIDRFEEILDAAAANGIRVIFEPGQTPLDLLPPGGAVSDEPATPQAVDALAGRFATMVETVYTRFPRHAELIAGWEVGNEPNLSYSFRGDDTYYADEGDPSAPRFWVVGLEQAQHYAEYLAAAAKAVAAVERSLGHDVTLIAAGIAHNDRAYMERMFATLNGLGAEIDAFAIHPYTFYDWPDPQSGRPTDWIPAPDGDAGSDWNYYHSFQGALYGIRDVAETWGYGESALYITEFGVPSFRGYRSAGPAGRADQARWFAEALGVLEAWGNDDLKAAIAHMVLDDRTAAANDRFDAYDDDPETPDGSAIVDSEGAFALFERLRTGGPIVAKPAVALMRAIADGTDFSDAALRIVSRVSAGGVDLSDRGSDGTGLTDGYIVLAHGGGGTVVGSAFDDSLFAGDGNDRVDAGAGADRVYGGRGDDVLNGNGGDDDIYGGPGDDRIDAGAGATRVDGGAGLDTLVLGGTADAFTITGDGRAFTVRAEAGRRTTEAINVEQVYFTGDKETVVLADGDEAAGNGAPAAAVTRHGRADRP